MTDLPPALRARLAAARPSPRRCAWPTDSVADDGETVKWLWRLDDGASIETVLMHYPDRATVCVSTQAGCAMACGFCATGQAGFTRHLTAGEIVEQVVAASARRPGPGRVSNVVFMGMGEPLANYDRVWAAVDRLHDDLGHLGPPPHRLDRRAWCPGSAAWPPRRCRSTWPCRCTPPTTTCATGWSRSTGATRWPTLIDACRRLPGGQGPSALVRVGPDRRRQRPARRRRRAGRPRPARWRPTSTSSRSTRRPATRRGARRPQGCAAFRDRLRRLGVNATVRQQPRHRHRRRLRPAGGRPSRARTRYRRAGVKLIPCPPTAGLTAPNRRRCSWR